MTSESTDLVRTGKKSVPAPLSVSMLPDPKMVSASEGANREFPLDIVGGIEVDSREEEKAVGLHSLATDVANDGESQTDKTEAVDDELPHLLSPLD